MSFDADGELQQAVEVEIKSVVSGSFEGGKLQRQC
jgi:hypothetical protein